MHLNVATQRKIPASLAAIRKQVVEAHDVPCLRQQPNGFCLGHDRISNVQCVACACANAVNPQAHRRLRQGDVVESTLHGSVQPNAPSEGGIVHQAAAQGVGQFKRKPPLARGVFVIVVKAVALKADRIVQLTFSEQGPSSHPNSTAVVTVHPRSWLKGERAPWVHQDSAVNDMRKFRTPHLVACQRGVLSGAAMKYGVLSSCHELHHLLVAIGQKPQVLNDPKRHIAKRIVRVDRHLHKHVHAVSWLQRHIPDRLGSVGDGSSVDVHPELADEARLQFNLIDQQGAIVVVVHLDGQGDASNRGEYRVKKQGVGGEAQRVVRIGIPHFSLATAERHTQSRAKQYESRQENFLWGPSKTHGAKMFNLHR